MNISSRLASMQRQANGDYRHQGSSYGYRIAKAAQNMVSIAMSQELEADSVRVRAEHPGRLQTGLAPKDATMDPAIAAERLVTHVEWGDPRALRYVSLEEGELPW